MKVVTVPYSRKTQKVIESILTLSISAGMGLIFVFTIDFNWKALTVITPIVLGSIYLMYSIMTLRIVIIAKDDCIITVIDNISENGFDIIQGEKHKKVKWEKLKEVKFSGNYDSLILIPFEGKAETLSNDVSNWYNLIQHIPKTFSSFDREYVKQYFGDLLTCKICGAIAIKINRCLSCGGEIWNYDLQKNYTTEEAYIIDQQLNLFFTMNSSQEVQLYIQSNNGFKLDKNWKPLVSKEEVRAYSKNNYWKEKKLSS